MKLVLVFIATFLEYPNIREYYTLPRVFSWLGSFASFVFIDFVPRGYRCQRFSEPTLHYLIHTMCESPTFILYNSVFLKEENWSIKLIYSNLKALLHILKFGGRFQVSISKKISTINHPNKRLNWVSGSICVDRLIGQKIPRSLTNPNLLKGLI